MDLIKRLADFNGGVLTRSGITLLRIVLIIVGLSVAGWIGRRLTDGLLRTDRIPGNWSDRRVQTIKGLVQSLLRYVLYFFGGMMILGELHVDTTSLLAGAGIVGLAAGFGAQNLVRDVITGFFILFEDQYAVGDYITAAGVNGIVEEMGMRITRIRQGSGELHIIPNGEIKQVTNFSRGGIGVSIDVIVAYEEDLERVTGVINSACRQVVETHRDLLLEEPVVLGVTQLGPDGVTLQVCGKVKPMQQWAIARELRQRIKEALDSAGIQIPYPHRMLIYKNQEEAGVLPGADRSGSVAGSDGDDSEPDASGRLKQNQEGADDDGPGTL